MKLELSKATIHYESFGKGHPLLALHGWMIDHRYMERLLEPAFDNRVDWKRIYIDIPGHGRSIATGAIKNSDDVLDTILEFIDTEMQGERFAIAGTSYGSILARGVVARRSDDIDGLLLVAPDIDHGSENTKLPSRTVLVKSEMTGADLQPLERRLFENELVVQSAEALEILREVVVPAWRIADSVLLEELSASYTLSFEEDMRTQRFDCPTLFLMGRQDHRTGYQNVWSIIENYPRASFAVLDRAGHTVGAIEQVNLCISLINDWLDRVEENQLGSSLGHR
jgi:pimeloyl-ACP methyl ester carboxylesterase